MVEWKEGDIASYPNWTGKNMLILIEILQYDTDINKDTLVYARVLLGDKQANPGDRGTALLRDMTRPTEEQLVELLELEVTK